MDFGTLRLEDPDGPGQEFLLSKAAITLGRATTNDVVLADAKVSRFHARIECDENGCTLSDLASANGTMVGSQRVDRSPLHSGDVIQVGDIRLVFESTRSMPDQQAYDTAGMTILAVPSPSGDAEVERSMVGETIVQLLPDMSIPRLGVRLHGRTWEVPLTEDVVTIGRSPANGVALEDPEVSREHARIHRRDEGFVVVDSGSTNGTWVDGHRVEEHQLETGTQVRIGPAVLVFKAAINPLDETVTAAPSDGKTTGRIPVVIVPGFMGSELLENGRLVWPNGHLALAKPDTFRWPDQKLVVRSILREHVIVPNFISLSRYSRLVDYLVEELGYRAGDDLLEFPYDWRQDNRVSARELAAAVAAWRSEKGHDEIAIIAHSMGCLISRYYVERLGGREHVRRLALVGGLNAGSPKTFQAFLAARGLLAFNSIRARFQQVVASFPSVYQSLPAYPCVTTTNGDEVDVFGDDSWLPENRRDYLKDAASFFAELGTATSVPTVCIFGYGLKTPVRLVVERTDETAWTAARLEVDESGDDTIPQASAILEGAEIHPVQQHHGVLYTDADVRMRLRLELIGR